MSTASVSFVGMALGVKLVGPDLGAEQVVFWRAFFSLPLLLAVVLLRRRPLIVRNWWSILRRSVFGFTAMYLYFYSLAHLTLADASILLKLQPVWIALLAPALVGDRPGGRVWGSLIVAVVGLAILLGPSISMGVLSLAGLAALVSSILSALAHLELRRLGRTDEPMVVVLNFTFLLLLMSGVASAPGATLPEVTAWPILVVIALCAMGGQFFMTSAYRAAPAPLVGVVSYLSLPLAVGVDWLVFGSTPSVWTILGGSLIIGAGLALARAPAEPTEPAPSDSPTPLLPAAAPSGPATRPSDAPPPR